MRELTMTVKEETLLKELTHDNIVQLYGVCKEEPIFALVMEVSYTLSLFYRSSHVQAS